MSRTKFYTGQGDKGASKMGKKQISKDKPLFQALGALDELNSWIGFCRAGATDPRLKEIAARLKHIQQSLFIAQAEVAAFGSGIEAKIKIEKTKTKTLEKIIHEVDAAIPAITKFVIPGASELSARLDVARVIARNVERIVIAAANKKSLRPELLEFLNRLSSALFAFARFANFKLKIKEEHPDYK